MKKPISWWPFFLLIPFFMGLVFVLTGTTEKFDTAVFMWVRANLSPFLDLPLKVFTTIGNPLSVIAIIAVLLIVPKVNKKIGIPAGLVTLVSWIFNEVIKHLVARIRPEFMVIEETGYSFPSGHAQNSTALYLTILFSLLAIIKSKKLRATLTVVFIVFPIIIGLSRVYFGVHFLTDVVSGWALGSFIAIIGFSLYRRLINNERH